MIIVDDHSGYRRLLANCRLAFQRIFVTVLEGEKPSQIYFSEDAILSMYWLTYCGPAPEGYGGNEGSGGGGTAAAGQGECGRGDPTVLGPAGPV